MFDPTVKGVAAILSQQRPGTCAWGWGKHEEPPHEPYAAFHLRVDNGHANGVLPKVLQLDMRRGLFVIGKVGVVVVLLRIGGCPYTFMTAVNHYSEVYQSPLRCWRDAKRQIVFFYEDKDAPVRGYSWDGDFTAFWQGIVDAVEGMEMWSEAEFNEASARVDSSPAELWDRL